MCTTTAGGGRRRREKVCIVAGVRGFAPFRWFPPRAILLPPGNSGGRALARRAKGRTTRPQAGARRAGFGQRSPRAGPVANRGARAEKRRNPPTPQAARAPRLSRGPARGRSGELSHRGSGGCTERAAGGNTHASNGGRTQGRGERRGERQPRRGPHAEKRRRPRRPPPRPHPSGSSAWWRCGWACRGAMEPVRVKGDSAQTCADASTNLRKWSVRVHRLGGTKWRSEPQHADVYPSSRLHLVVGVQNLSSRILRRSGMPLERGRVNVVAAVDAHAGAHLTILRNQRQDGG